MVISAFYGLNGSSTVWNGIPVLPAGQDPYGSDIIVAHARHVQGDLLRRGETDPLLVLTLMDCWVLDRAQIRELIASGIPVAHWLPVDVDRPRRPDGKPDGRPRGLGKMDEAQLRETGATAVAMSQFGRRKLIEAGIPAFYVPHSIDTSIFAPPEDRDALRHQFGLTGRFVISISQANKDTVRKGYPTQMLAFARFRERHPEALLSIHATRAAPGALNLDEIAEDLGISDALAFNDQYGLVTGAFSPESLGSWYGASDLLSATALGEGFGIPIIEAMACGTPVGVTAASAMTELCGAGWKVEKAEPFWNMAHRSWWSLPHVAEVEKAYEKAWQLAQNPARMAAMRARARQFSLDYDAGLVFQRDWVPVLDELFASAAGGATPLRPLERDRDATLARLQDAFNAGSLDAGAFGERAQKALAASAGEDLAALVADLPEAAVAALWHLILGGSRRILTARSR